jgi:digeranylgeranylglycerophospholipid reductase
VKYDVIVVGAGPAGLMAARVAAENGLKTLVLERKKIATDVTRACVQTFYINKRTPNSETGTWASKHDGYIDHVSVEILPDKARFHFHVPGFHWDFAGSCRPFQNWLQLSPNGTTVHRYEPNTNTWGFLFDKEAVLETLLAEAVAAGAEVLTEKLVIAAEDRGDSVAVRVREKSGEQVIEGKKLIASDGISSRVVETLGFNEGRTVRPTRHILMYVLEDVGGPWAQNSMMSWTFPSLNKTGNILISLLGGRRNLLLAGATSGSGIKPADILDGFMQHPNVQDVVGKAKVVDQKPTAITARSPIPDPARANVIITGDAGSSAETWVQGAIASGYMAAKAVLKELDGQPGNQEYNEWWLKGFAFNTPAYAKLLAGMYPLSRVCTDDELDYVYSLMEGQIGIPALLLRNQMEVIQRDRPELYQRLSVAIGPK